MKHYRNSEWVETLPLEFKEANGDDPDPIAAIESLGADIKKRDSETKSAIDRIDAEIAKLKRPSTEKKTGEPTLEQKAFENFVRKGQQGLSPDEFKTMRVSSEADGGYLAPDQFLVELLRNVRLFSPVRQVARVMPTGAGAVLLPKRTGGLTAQWVGETAVRPATQPTFGQNRYPVKELAAYVDVSNAVLEDSEFDIVQLLALEFAIEFGAREGTAFVVGSGVLDPLGFMSDTSLSYTPGGDASLLKADGLIDLFHAIPSPYRANAHWAMNATTLGAARKLKDSSTGTYLLMPAGFNGAPADTILGKPVLEMQDMPDIGTNTYPVAFGDFNQGYRIFDRLSVSILRDPFSISQNGQTRFHGRRRVAGGVGLAEAIRKLKIATS